MNINFSITVENCIFLDMFKKYGVIFHYFLIAFCIKKGTFDNADILIVYSYPKEKNAFKVSKTERGKGGGTLPQVPIREVKKTRFWDNQLLFHFLNLYVEKRLSRRLWLVRWYLILPQRWQIYP